jgi:NAD(P)-dependent dehydrogenase (short-subunit alcohol dehydrogenase family)
MSSQEKKDNSIFTRDNLFNLHGKVALVTGGGSGIGLMATQALAGNGAKVYITGRTKEKLDKVVETYGKNIAGEIVAIPGDVGTKEGVRKLYEDYAQKEKCLCILVNNAGISSATFQTEAKDATEMRKNLFDADSATFDDWTTPYNTNVAGLYFMSTAFLPLLEKSTELHKGWSSTIINITSISGMIQKAQHHFAYNASKGAAIHVSRMLAAEVAANGLKIRVNSLAPGVFPSEMTTEGSDEHQKSHIPAEKYAEKVPARRPGRDEDMAQTILFFAANQYLNGQNVAVDGGYTLSAGM